MKKLFTLLTIMIMISMVVSCVAQATPSPITTKEVIPTQPVAQPTQPVAQPTQPEAQPTQPAASKEVIELTLWHQESPPRRVDAFQKIIDRFNSENPGIHVTQAPQSWAEIYAKLYASIEAGNPPDMLFSIPDLTMAMKLTGAVTPVEEIVNAVDTEYGLLASQITPYEYDGHIWAVPMWGMTHLLCFNKAQFEEAGISYPMKTWDELLSAGEKLTKGNVFGIGFPASQLMMTDQNVYDYMVTNRCEVFDKDGNVAIDSPACVQSFTFYDKLLDYAPPDVVNWNWGDSEMAFLAETISTIQLFPSLAEWMKAEKAGGGPFSCQTIPLPPGGRNGAASYSNGATIFTKDPARLEAIKTFLLYLHAPDVNGEWLSSWDAGVYLPITDASMKSETYWSNEVIQYYKDIVNLQFEATADGQLFGFEYSPVPIIGRVAGENILGQMAGKLAVNEMTPEEVCKWAADTIKAWMKESE